MSPELAKSRGSREESQLAAQRWPLLWEPIARQAIGGNSASGLSTVERGQALVGHTAGAPESTAPAPASVPRAAAPPHPTPTSSLDLFGIALLACTLFAISITIVKL
jgi:hypothetical protein